jgi:ribosome-associated protein
MANIQGGTPINTKSNLAQVTKLEATTLSPYEILLAAAAAASDTKAQNPLALKIPAELGLTDYFLIASGHSDRQAQGIANKILETAEKLGIEVLSVEGYDSAQWILIDLGSVVAHIFYEPTRAHYDLESLWMTAERVELNS